MADAWLAIDPGPKASRIVFALAILFSLLDVGLLVGLVLAHDPFLLWAVPLVAPLLLGAQVVVVVAAAAVTGALGRQARNRASGKGDMR